MAQKARKTIRSRSGKVTGKARAAASETTPRIPAQEMMVAWVHGVGASRRRIEGSRRGSRVAGNTQTKRETISTSDSATASRARWPAP